MRVVVGPNILGLELMVPALAQAHPEYEFSFCSERSQLAAALQDADVLFGWLNRDELLRARSLKWVQSPSSGINNYLDIPEFVESDILLTSARGTHGPVLADHVFAMILCHTRKLREALLNQAARRWEQAALRAQSIELTGSTMGIVGLGCVGREVARRAEAFGMRVLAVDAFPGERPGGVERLDDLSGLPALLAESEYVVVTVPYTPDTHGMIGAREFAQMKPGAFVVGISRGGIVDEAALAQALRTSKLAGAAMDVCVEEPLPATSELWGLDNLLITPHSAGGTQLERQRLFEIFHENLDRFLQRRFPLRNQIDKRRGF